MCMYKASPGSCASLPLSGTTTRSCNAEQRGLRLPARPGANVYRNAEGRQLGNMIDEWAARLLNAAAVRAVKDREAAERGPRRSPD